MTGFITEVLEYMSVENVRPAIYDVTLKGKALNNEDCKAMLDLIFSTTYLDFNANYKFGGVLDAVNQAIFFGQPFASAYASLETKLNADLEEFYAEFRISQAAVWEAVTFAVPSFGRSCQDFNLGEDTKPIGVTSLWLLTTSVIINLY